MNIRFRTIVSGGSGAYLRRVSLTRLIRFLAVLALIVSPLATFVAMPGSARANHAAMAAGDHWMAGHEMAGHGKPGNASTAPMQPCNDMGGKPTDRPCGPADSDCAKACAAVPAIPAVGGQVEPQVSTKGLRRMPALVSAPHGLAPEAATPPPRAS